jgi:hypothetical protein
LHIASEGEDSEVPPCCGNLGILRDLLRAVTTNQEPRVQKNELCWPDYTEIQLVEYFDDLVQPSKDDGAAPDNHGLEDPKAYPLLHRVVDGIRANQERFHAKRAEEREQRTRTER